MIEGTIQRIYVDKAFGFIRDPETGLEYFFHKSAVRGAKFEDLRETQPVEFEAGEGPKGLRAEQVRLV